MIEPLLLLPPLMSSIVVEPSTTPVFTLAEAKLRAGLSWADGDERDALMKSFVAAATNKVQIDTGFALLTQTRDVLVDGSTLPAVLQLPALSRPLQDVLAVAYVSDPEIVETTVDPSVYLFDTRRASLLLAPGAAWPTNAHAEYGWTVRIVSGWTDVAELPPLLVQAVGLLTAHYATVGRDLATVGTIIEETPYGYDDCVAPYRPVLCA